MAKSEVHQQYKDMGHTELLEAYFKAADDMAAYNADAANRTLKGYKERSDAIGEILKYLRPAHQKELKRANPKAAKLPANWLPTSKDREWLADEQARLKKIRNMAAKIALRPNGKAAAANDSTADSDGAE